MFGDESTRLSGAAGDGQDFVRAAAVRRGDPAARLRALVYNWDEALAAVLTSDFERATDLLAANQELLRQPAPVGAVDPQHADLHTEAMAAHGRLIGTLRSLHRGVREELMRVRVARRARTGRTGGAQATRPGNETRA